jgi:signal transduction histidine kinase
MQSLPTVGYTGSGMQQLPPELLGLSMTHVIVVKQYGGRIDVQTEPGAFTEFIVTLPRGNSQGAKLE